MTPYEYGSTTCDICHEAGRACVFKTPQGLSAHMRRWHPMEYSLTVLSRTVAVFNSN